MSGFGHLTIGSPGHATPVARWIVQEGGTLATDALGRLFTFTLERAPLPSQYDIRELSTLALAEYLAKRIEDEDEAHD